MKANSNQAVLRTLAQLGAGADVVSEGELRRALAAGIPPRQDRLFRRRQDGARDGLSRSRPASTASTSNPSPSSSCCRRAPPRARQDGAGLAAHQSRCRRRHPRQDLDRQGGEQVRHRRGSARARSTRGPPALPGSRVTGIDTHIGSQITELQPFDDAFALLAELVGDVARRRPRHRACRPRRRARHPLPHRQRPAAAARRLCRHRQEACRARSGSR